MAGVTFVAAHTSSRALATTAKYTISFLGEVASMGTTALFGDVAGVSVRVLSKTAASTTEQAMNQSGYVTAGVAAALAGATTALSISVGERVVSYSIEHGGRIGKELAEKISETYVRYRAIHGTLETNEAIDDWVEIDGPNGSTICTSDGAEGTRECSTEGAAE